MAGLPWVRLDGTFPQNPKILSLLARRGGHAAAFVYCCGLAYSGRHGTDGYIPAAALPFIHGRKADAANLVAGGLWVPVDGGWQVPDWAEYQQTSAVSEQVQGARRAGAVKGNCIRWHGPECGCWRKSTNLRVLL